MRADLHTLFDLSLIKIHPESLAVSTDKRLIGTEYAQLDGVILRDRIDGSRPSNKYLSERWY